MKIITGLFMRYQAHRLRQNMMVGMIFGSCCVIAIVIAIIGSIVVNTLNTIEGATVRQKYGDTIANACNPMPSGNISEENLSAGEAPLEIVLLAAETPRRHRWQSDLPTQWQADNRDEVDLVACVQEERVTIETCEYERAASDGDGTFTVRVEREQYQVTLLILNPETGRIIASQSIEGSEPEDCPDEGVTASRTETGERVELNEFSAWIETYVFAEN